MFQDSPRDEVNPTIERQILDLMTRQARQAREIKRLQERTPLNQAAIDSARVQHRDTVNELIRLLYIPLKKALEGLDPRLHNAGAQYTEMVHDFFLKLLEQRVAGDQDFDTFTDLKRFVSTVLMNQFRDHLKSGKTLRDHGSAIAPIAEQKRKYFEDRYGVPYVDFLDKVEQWQDSGDENLQLLARAMLLRYVAGEKWGVIARELRISDERLNKLRREAGEEFRQKKIDNQTEDTHKDESP